MNPLTRLVINLLLAALALTFGAKMIKAQDPVQVDPKHYKVLYEDTNVRVLQYDDTPGHVVPKHTHKYPFKVFVITDAVRNFMPWDSKTNECQKPGSTTKLFANEEISKPPTTHCEVNTGNTDTHLIIIDFKKTPAPPTRARRRHGNSLKPTRR